MRGWFLKGSKPIIETIYTRERVSVFGALSENELSFKTTEDKCNYQTYLKFLKSLLEKHEKILVVVDGAKYHFEKEHVQKFYKENESCLKVMQLPPYSPELNPIEQVWKETKKWLAITPWGNKEEFKLKLTEGLNNPEFKIKMFDYYLR